MTTKRVAVTGLSGAGKTVFLVSLINHLMEGKGLPYFEQANVSYIAEEYEPSTRDLRRFPYEKYLDAFRAEDPPERWPEHTSDVSSITLDITLQDEANLRRTKRVRLELVDYPGEKLVDLPMVGQGYAEWSDGLLRRARRNRRDDLSRPWLEMVKSLRNEDNPAPDQLVQTYGSYLQECWKRSLVNLQPSALLETDGKDRYDISDLFCPLPQDVRNSHPALAETFRKRYEDYVENTHDFYRDVVRRCSSQVVLVDLLDVLESGVESYNETKACLEKIITLYNHGAPRRPWDPRRLLDYFRPKVKKVIFVATQIDRCGGDRGNLKYLLEDMIERICLQLQGTVRDNVSCYCCAAHRCTEDRAKKADNGQRPALHGVLKNAADRGSQDWAASRVPDEWPDDWDPDEERFQFPQFCPPRFPGRDGAVTPHINLDKIAYYLLRDYLP